MQGERYITTYHLQSTTPEPGETSNITQCGVPVPCSPCGGCLVLDNLSCVSPRIDKNPRLICVWLLRNNATNLIRKFPLEIRVVRRCFHTPVINPSPSLHSSNRMPQIIDRSVTRQRESQLRSAQKVSLFRDSIRFFWRRDWGGGGGIEFMAFFAIAKNSYNKCILYGLVCRIAH